MKPCKSRSRLERKKKKGTTDLLSFLEGSGWESGFPLRQELAFLPEQETLSSSGLQSLQSRAWPDGLAMECGLQPETAREKLWMLVSDFLLGFNFVWGPHCKLRGRPDTRQSNKLPGILKCLHPSSSSTSLPSPFLPALRGAAG